MKRLTDHATTAEQEGHCKPERLCEDPISKFPEAH
jgi:hypothetical protein